MVEPLAESQLTLTIPEDVQKTIKLLNVTSLAELILTQHYLIHNEVTDPGKKAEMYSQLGKNIGEYRRSVDPESPSSSSAQASVAGLFLAFNEMLIYVGDSLLQKHPGFEEALKEKATGLVQKKTQEYTDFQTHASQVK